MTEALAGMENVAEHINEMQRIHEEYGAIFDHLYRQYQRSNRYYTTPPNFKVCARRKVPEKFFKICHILYIRKPKVAFFVFHFVLLYIFT